MFILPQLQESNEPIRIRKRIRSQRVLKSDSPTMPSQPSPLSLPKGPTMVPIRPLLKKSPVEYDIPQGLIFRRFLGFIARIDPKEEEEI